MGRRCETSVGQLTQSSKNFNLIQRKKNFKTMAIVHNNNNDDDDVDEDLPDCFGKHVCCLAPGGDDKTHRVDDCEWLKKKLKEEGKLENVEKYAPKAKWVCTNCQIPPGTRFSHDSKRCFFPPPDYECGACCEADHWFRNCRVRATLPYPLSRKWKCKNKPCGQEGGVEGLSHWTKNCPMRFAPEVSEQERPLAAVGEERRTGIPFVPPPPPSLAPKSRGFPSFGFTCHSCGQGGGDPILSHWRKHCPEYTEYTEYKKEKKAFWKR